TTTPAAPAAPAGPGRSPPPAGAAPLSRPGCGTSSWSSPPSTPDRLPTGPRGQRLPQAGVQVVALVGVHHLFQEQGPHGGHQGGGLPGRVPGAGQPVEGEAV